MVRVATYRSTGTLGGGGYKKSWISSMVTRMILSSPSAPPPPLALVLNENTSSPLSAHRPSPAVKVAMYSRVLKKMSSVLEISLPQATAALRKKIR
jgi:hypothetical protein